MANAVYGKGRQHILQGDIAYLTDSIRCFMCTSGYTASINADEFVSSIGSGSNPTMPANTLGVLADSIFASKTSTLGTANAANLTFHSISGSQITQLIILKDTSNWATSPLIARIDTATGLPLTPNGGDININWDTGSNKIFTL